MSHNKLPKFHFGDSACSTLHGMYWYEVGIALGHSSVLTLVSGWFFDTKTSTSQYTRVVAWHLHNTGMYNQKMFPDYTPSILHSALHSGPRNLVAKLEILSLRSQAPTLPIAELKPQTHMEKSLDWVVT